jgi:hypothetical protein
MVDETTHTSVPIVCTQVAANTSGLRVPKIFLVLSNSGIALESKANEAGVGSAL